MCTDQKKCVQKMEIKHSISFFLQKVYSRTGNGEGQIRLRVRWNGNTYQANSGYTILPERWENGRCKRNAFNSRGVSASDINRQLAALEGIVEDIFKAFEVADTVPSLDVFKAEFAKRTGKGGHVKDCGSFEKALHTTCLLRYLTFELFVLDTTALIAHTAQKPTNQIHQSFLRHRFSRGGVGDYALSLCRCGKLVREVVGYITESFLQYCHLVRRNSLHSALYVGNEVLGTPKK